MAAKMTKNQMRRAKKKEQKKAKVGNNIKCDQKFIKFLQATETPDPEAQTPEREAEIVKEEEDMGDSKV